MGEDVSAGLSRRAVLGVGAAAAAAGALPAQAAQPPIPIIDTHIHLFDGNRPQGAPYTGPPNSPTHRTGAYPAIYAKLARPLGIVGAIEVEASPWVEDNLWVLEVAQANDIMVGTVGNLRPEAADFGELLGRFHKNPLFRGVRHGNLWGYDMPAQAKDPAFIAGLKLLAQADLALDTANQNLALLQATVRVSDAVPDLRIVIDHLPAYDPKPEEMAAYDAALRELKGRPQVYSKISEVIHTIDGKTRTDLPAYRAHIERLYETFGEDRVLFGSDWPNSDSVAPVPTVLGLVKAYFAGKPRAVQEKYFWKNSVHAYKWVHRTASQPKLA
jgi:predicted TIM-barrel fold metal-dependent hydrolase